MSFCTENNFSGSLAHSLDRFSPHFCVALVVVGGGGVGCTGEEEGGTPGAAEEGVRGEPHGAHEEGRGGD
jgi:hypothetical protein